MDTYSNIIVHLPNWLGDTVLATPFLHALRDVFPKARLTVAGRRWVTDCLLHFPGLDRILTLDDPDKSVSTTLLIRHLREGNYDLGFLLTNSFRTALAFRWGGVKERVGYALDFRRLLLTRPIKPSDDIMKASMVEYYMRLLNPFADISSCPRLLKLYPSDEEWREAQRLLLENGWDGLRRLVGINPFAFQWDAKRWLPERFAAVADRLIEKHNVQCVFLSNEKDRPLFEKIKSLCRHDVIDLVGKSPLPVVPAILERYALFITNDSGLMHVAAALDIPIVAIFGPTDWQRTAPYSQKAILIRKELDHPPCMKPVCRRDFACMNQITEEEVYAAAEKFL